MKKKILSDRKPSGRKEQQRIKKIALEKKSDIEEYTNEFRIYTWHPPAFSLIKPLNYDAAKKIGKEILRQTGSICFAYDVDNNLRRELFLLKRQYQKTKNPVYILQSFLKAHTAGLYPSVMVLNVLAEAFKDYIDSWGRKSLDDILKIKLGIDKKDNAFTLIDKKGFEGVVFMDVCKLICLFNLHVKEAVHMVDRKLEDAREKGITLNRGYKIPKIDIHDRYNRKKGNQYKKAIWKELFSKYTDEEKKDLLKDYPIDSIPDHIRKKYKIQ